MFINGDWVRPDEIKTPVDGKKNEKMKNTRKRKE